MATTRRVQASCFMCGGAVAFDVTEHPRTAWANDTPTSTYRTVYVGRDCDCTLTGWADRFAEDRAWRWMRRGIIARFDRAGLPAQLEQQ